MHLRLLPLLPVAVRALNIVSSNDDGWAEANIRALHDSLNAEGHSVLISAPADNQSGKGMYYYSGVQSTRYTITGCIF